MWSSHDDFLDTMKLQGRDMFGTGQGFLGVLQALTFSPSLLAHEMALTVIFSTYAKS